MAVFIFCMMPALVRGRAGAADIAEVNIPTVGATPQGIVQGPDGALWFTEFWANRIGRFSSVGVFTEFVVPTQPSHPFRIVTGPDNNLWFTESYTNKIGRVTTNGIFTEFTTPTPLSQPSGITVGPDGNLWFLEFASNKVGRVDSHGANFAEFSVVSPTNNLSIGLYNIITGPDSNLWFTENISGKIGRITTDGTITEFPLPLTNSQPLDIIVGPDGAMWFTEFGTNRIGRITVDAIPGDNSFITEFQLPTNIDVVLVTNEPCNLMVGRDGNIWFTDYGGSSIGRMTTSGVVTKFFTPTTNSFPTAITIKSNGNMWFCEYVGSSPGFVHNLALFITPTLVIQPTADLQHVVLSWPNNATNFQLQANGDLTTTNWVNITNKPVVINNRFTLTNLITPSNRFFRLKE